MNESVRDIRSYELGSRLLEDALHALQEKTQIQGGGAPLAVTTHHQPDAAVDLSIDGQCYHYLVECKNKVDRKVQIDQIALKLQQIGTPSMLVTEYLSKELASYCQTLGLQFIDTHGNAYLRAPGLFIYTTGEKNEYKHQYERAPKGLTNQAALRVVFALLSKPELIKGTFKEIAAMSNVSLGTAHNVLGELLRRGYLIADVKNTRTLLEPRRLAEEWAINFPLALRTKLNRYRFTCPDPSWWESVNIADFHASWGSEVAATKMFRHLKPSTQTMYVDPKHGRDLIGRLVKTYRLRPDPHGQIEILERFWSPQVESVPGIAPPLAVYADLLGLMDPRAKETAQLIMEKFIEPSHYPD
ncbi:type IV toxin-antitoxin system AbiEi family antitoxin [Leeia oryzae]|uniref:type IV toxin-antitoxin system AbiEi family antitoxin n=1 Tax=Leeia oryzae TaxID=356662 RepID=UPI00036BCDF1|nr:type IV toxin-antitoxin system AbiEi family antitoxin [Leeia oryzae]